MTALVSQLLADCARRPAAPALVSAEGIVTDRAMLARQVAAGARALAALGVRPGDRVLLSAPNSPDLAAAYFAIHAAGGVAVLLAPDTAETDRAEVIERTRPRLCIGAGEGARPPAEFLAGNGNPAEITPPDPAAAADLLFTTGTTGRRKGVVLSHGAIAAIARNLVQLYSAGPALLQAVPLPMTHSHGLGTIRAMAAGGHALLLLRGLVSPGAVLQRIADAGATGLALVPAAAAFLRRYAGQALAGLAGQLKLIELGSAPIDPELRAWLVETLPRTRILHHYGMTEASRAVFADYGRDPPGSAGRPAPGVRLTIADAAGRPVPAGTAGEVHVAGDILMSGYWQAEGLLDRSRLGPHGFASGDMGVMSAEGLLTLLGRIDDVINVGGRKVVPEEVEQALVAAHGAVLDACCVGAPDPVLGEVVEAHLVLAEGADLAALASQLEAALAGRLESHKLPRRWKQVERLPRTESGKLQRARLRR